MQRKIITAISRITKQKRDNIKRRRILKPAPWELARVSPAMISDEYLHRLPVCWSRDLEALVIVPTEVAKEVADIEEVVLLEGLRRAGWCAGSQRRKDVQSWRRGGSCFCDSRIDRWSGSYERVRFISFLIYSATTSELSKGTSA